MDNIKTLIKGASEFNIELSKIQKNKFIKYKDLLKEWNEKINITSIVKDEEIDIKHFLDSISIVTEDLIKGKEKIIDIGTGGGFPGIPIKILEEDINLVLLDGLKKRLKFLDIVTEELGLKDVETIHGRAEELGNTIEYREQFDIATSRAVASLNILSEYCLPFVKVNGLFIAMKGPKIEEEIKNSESAVKKLGGNIEKIVEIKLPLSEINHTLIIIRKEKKTGAKFPRNGGKIKKIPL